MAAVRECRVVVGDRCAVVVRLQMKDSMTHSLPCCGINNPQGFLFFYFINSCAPVLRKRNINMQPCHYALMTSLYWLKSVATRLHDALVHIGVAMRQCIFFG